MADDVTFARAIKSFDDGSVSTRLNDYNYELPRELIAQHPLPRRQDSRMMVLHRDRKKIEHAHFVDLEKFLRDDDLLVLNNSRVLPARHFSDDGKIEFLCLEKTAPCHWKALVKPSRKFLELFRTFSSRFMSGWQLFVRSKWKTSLNIKCIPRDFRLRQARLRQLRGHDESWRSEQQPFGSWNRLSAVLEKFKRAKARRIFLFIRRSSFEWSMFC